MNGQNAKKRGMAGKDWWGKRPFSGLSVSLNSGMKYWKRQLHKKERQEAKNTMIDIEH